MESATKSAEAMSTTVTPSTIALATASSSNSTVPPPKKRKQRDSTLDFFSSDFDAAKALHTPGLKPPLPLPPLPSWQDAVALADVDACIYRDLYQSDAVASIVPFASAAAAFSPSIPPPAAAAAAPLVVASSAWSSSNEDSNSLLDMLDDSRYDENAEVIKSEQVIVSSSSTAAASSSVSAVAAAPVSSASAHLPPLVGALGVVSRMSAEQIRINREKAEKKTQENAEKKGHTSDIHSNSQRAA